MSLHRLTIEALLAEMGAAIEGPMEGTSPRPLADLDADEIRLDIAGRVRMLNAWHLDVNRVLLLLHLQDEHAAELLDRNNAATAELREASAGNARTLKLLSVGMGVLAPALTVGFKFGLDLVLAHWGQWFP